MSTPIISIIIPAFNEEKHIARCLRSILSQSMERDSYEVIVVNDASTDHTPATLKFFGNEIQVLHNEKNLGLPASLNLGIRSAKGRFIVRLDADDYVTADYLYALYLFLQLNPYMDAVACDYFMVDDQENVLARYNCHENPIGCGILFRVEQLIEIGLYDEEFFLHEDRELRIRFEKKYSIHRVELPLYRYRRHENNITNDREGLNRFSEKLAKKHPSHE